MLVPPKPYALANLPSLPPNAHDPPAPGIEAALNEPRREAFRAMKALGLEGEHDPELWPYFRAAERGATSDIARIGLAFGDGECDSITAGLVAEANLARAMSHVAIARNDLAQYARLVLVYGSLMKRATEMVKAASDVRSGPSPWDEAPAPAAPTATVIDVAPEPDSLAPVTCHNHRGAARQPQPVEPLTGTSLADLLKDTEEP